MAADHHRILPMLSGEDNRNKQIATFWCNQFQMPMMHIYIFMNNLKLEFVTSEVFSHLRAKYIELRNLEGTKKTAAWNHAKYDSNGQVSHTYETRDIDNLI